MKTKLVVSEYEGLLVPFTEDGWFNATAVAAKFDKRVDNWLRTEETKEYIAALTEYSNTSEVRYLKTKRGNSGGTWFSPELAVPFARWLDVRFAVWCDQQIKALISGKHAHFDWKRARHEAAATHKVAMSILQAVRADEGKETKFYHYATEAKLINWALTGEFKPLDRANLNYDELDLLAKIEEKDALLIGRGRSYEQRKLLLEEFVADWRLTKDKPRLLKEAEALYLA